MLTLARHKLGIAAVLLIHFQVKNLRSLTFLFGRKHERIKQSVDSKIAEQLESESFSKKTLIKSKSLALLLYVKLDRRTDRQWTSSSFMVFARCHTLRYSPHPSASEGLPLSSHLLLLLFLSSSIALIHFSCNIIEKRWIDYFIHSWLRSPSCNFRSGQELKTKRFWYSHNECPLLLPWSFSWSLGTLGMTFQEVTWFPYVIIVILKHFILSRCSFSFHHHQQRRRHRVSCLLDTFTLSPLLLSLGFFALSATWCEVNQVPIHYSTLISFLIFGA